MQRCPQCGGEMRPNAPKGLCPKCLFGAALDIEEPPMEPREEVPERIGRYKILQRLGEGGCGVVYLAEQEAPIRRQVAVKLIKPGMDTRQVIARFEAERQSLALMHHSNIAKVFDAGTLPNGRSYFVMELVRGVRITEYCDRFFFSARERLELFVQVCQAIQHAHKKGIIHRDIKPSNILVAQQDGRAVPILIDFGIAKATAGQVLTDKTLFTAFEQFLGTPAYMSPEQVDRRRDIDASTDIYSLGVLLYELLTGNTPFEGSEMREGGWETIRRRICETEPQTPSTRLTSLAPMELMRIAKCRRAEGLRLVDAVRGDLDWIVMKCLEKEPARRYQSSGAIADDIGRHLRQEPIEARPVSNVYRFEKMVRRNRLLVGAIGGVFLSLLIGMGLSIWFYVRERAAKQKARQAEQQALIREGQALIREEQALKREIQAQRKYDFFREIHVNRKFYPTNGVRYNEDAEFNAQSLSLAVRRSAEENDSAPESILGEESNPVSPNGISANTSGISPVVPPGDGKYYSELAAWWWKWFMEIAPFDEVTGLHHPAINGVFDEIQGQGVIPSFQFLAAPFGTTIRECEIPQNTYIFMPLLNVESSNLEDYPFYGETREMQMEVAKYFADHIEPIYLEINGVSIENLLSHRVQNRQISFNAPSPWIFGDEGGYGTSTGEGYYLLLRPLPPGEHAIYYFGAFRFQQPKDPFTDYFPIEMTYHVTVR